MCLKNLLLVSANSINFNNKNVATPVKKRVQYYIVGIIILCATQRVYW